MAFLPNANLLAHNICRRTGIVKHHHFSANGENEFLDLGEARTVKRVRDLGHGHTCFRCKGSQPPADFPGGRSFKIHPNLEAPPHGAIKKLGVVGCTDQDGIGRQIVDLHQQRADHTLYLARLVRVPSLFTDGVEFIEKENARGSPREIEYTLQSTSRLPKITADKALVAGNEKRQRELMSNRFG